MSHSISRAQYSASSSPGPAPKAVSGLEFIFLPPFCLVVPRFYEIHEGYGSFMSTCHVLQIPITPCIKPYSDGTCSSVWRTNYSCTPFPSSLPQTRPIIITTRPNSLSLIQPIYDTFRTSGRWMAASNSRTASPKLDNFLSSSMSYYLPFASCRNLGWSGWALPLRLFTTRHLGCISN